MKLWLTAAEIADLKLPGLPGTKRNVNAHAEAAGWPERKALCRKRRHTGGGIEYSLDLLPPEARKAYVARFVPDAVPLEIAEAAEAEPAAVHLRSDAAEARDARLAILAVADRVFASANLPRLHADLVTIADYRANKIDLPEWVRVEVPELSLRTLQRWRAAVQAGQATALAVDRGAARRGSGVLDQAEDGQVRVYCLALIATQPHLSADHVRAMLLKRFGETLSMVRAGGVVKTVPLPPVRTLQDALKRWKANEKVALTAITNPDAFKSRYKLSGANTDRSVTRLNEVWQIDASPMDALCVDGRHSVYLAIDVFSRRAVVYVSRTPRAEAVGLMLRRAILAWGVPERIKTDNGSDFTAKSIQRLLASLGIERELSPAFTPEAKAFVERVIGTFQRDFAPLLPGFIGHSVADRKVIEARKAFAQRLGESDANAFAVELTAAQLQAYCDQWAADRYQHRPHAGLDGATPYTAAAAYAGRTRTLDDVRCLDILLAPIPGRDGLRTVGKQGLRLEKSLYLAPHIMPETQVFVRMDPNDLGRAFLFSLDGGQYLGEAVCPEILGVDPAQAVAHAKKAQKDLISVATAQIRREAKKIKPRDFVETILEQAAEKSGNLVAFPRPSDAHATAATRAAVDALSDVVTVETWPTPATKPGESEGARALRTEIEADLAGTAPPAADNVQPLRRTETKQQRFRRAMELLARIEAGEAIPTTDAVWLGGYQAGSEYRALHDLYADFGEAALK